VELISAGFTFVTTICGILNSLKVLTFWIATMIGSVLKGVLLIAVCYKFRMRQSLHASYGDSEKGYRVDGDAPRPWEPSMMLPEIPQLQSRSRSVVDGADP
jgi:hypothetical protein